MMKNKNTILLIFVIVLDRAACGCTHQLVEQELSSPALVVSVIYSSFPRRPKAKAEGRGLA